MTTTQPTTSDTKQINLRLDPGTREAVAQLAEGNGVSETEAARLLLRRGIRAVVVENPVPLSDAEYAYRLHGFMEAASDLLERMARHDSEGAARLAERATKAFSSYTRDLKKRRNLR